MIKINNLEIKKQDNFGITLVALVVTIIVLLILAGVSLSLVAGQNGILRRATDAIDKYNIETAKEEIQLAMAELQTQYYEDRYFSDETSSTYQDYAQEKLTEGIKTSSGAMIKLSGQKVSYTLENNNKTLITGTFNSETRRCGS